MNILITGATGAFGQAFVESILVEQDLVIPNLGEPFPVQRYERICIYSRDEWKQAQMRLKFNDDRLRFFIGDVRDKPRLQQAMDGIDIVVHAAALKRVETCEYNSTEMTKTNVLGSMNVIETAYDAGVSKVVALSTDKACNPVNAYGSSKLLAEKLFLAANHTYGEHGPKYSVVRYGNVWKSTGSVVPIWKNIINKYYRAAQKPNTIPDELTVPVTNPECTRYFMRLSEACDLVKNTISTMNGNETIIPDLPAYQLKDLAEAMGVNMDIVGLEPREKLHETMDGVTDSSQARRMTVKELREALRE